MSGTRKKNVINNAKGTNIKNTLLFLVMFLMSPFISRLTPVSSKEPLHLMGGFQVNDKQVEPFATEK